MHRRLERLANDVKALDFGHAVANDKAVFEAVMRGEISEKEVRRQLSTKICANFCGPGWCDGGWNMEDITLAPDNCKVEKEPDAAVRAAA